MQVRWLQRCKCVGERGKAWQSAPTGHKPSADARIMLAPNPYLLYIFHHKRLFTSVCARLPPTPTTPLLTPVYQLASLAALDTLASARLRRALPLSLSFFSFFFSLPYKLVRAPAARLPPLPLFTHTPAMSARFARCLGNPRVGAPAARIALFSYYSLSFFFPFPFPFSFSLISHLVINHDACLRAENESSRSVRAQRVQCEKSASVASTHQLTMNARLTC